MEIRMYFQIPKEGHKPFESDYLLDAVHMTVFNTKWLMAYICTLCHHIVYLHQEGKFDNWHLNAIQQGGTFKLYLDKLAEMKKRKPGNLWNLQMRIWNYCMEFHVEPDPRLAVTPPLHEWSPNVTELVGTQFLSHLPSAALDHALDLLLQDQGLPEQGVFGNFSDKPMWPKGKDVDRDADEDTETWNIMSDSSSEYFLVGHHHTIQVNSDVVDNILGGYVSAQEVVDITMKGAIPSASQASPSGLSNVEKKAIVQVPGTAHIEVVGSDNEPEAPQDDIPDPKISWLYNRHYLNKNGGVEQYGRDEAQIFLASFNAHCDIEPITMVDEEMECDQDD
ncbi:hypothetical protein FRC11_005789 [Ceratobasidium sp. 423]|nr:hypothetical protein FRC11_005789 [Ceratobasidium sp. 423]